MWKAIKNSWKENNKLIEMNREKEGVGIPLKEDTKPMELDLALVKELQEQGKLFKTRLLKRVRAGGSVEWEAQQFTKALRYKNDGGWVVDKEESWNSVQVWWNIRNGSYRDIQRYTTSLEDQTTLLHCAISEVITTLVLNEEVVEWP